MQQQTDPTRLCRLSSVPLTLFAQGADTTVSNSGGVEHSQRAIVLGALHSAGAGSCLLDTSVFHRAARQSPFPKSSQLSEAGGGGGWAIARRGSRRIDSLLLDRRDGRSKLSRANGGRLQLMPQFQEPRSTPIVKRSASIPLPEGD
jgi:hypothetical protein